MKLPAVAPLVVAALVGLACSGCLRAKAKTVTEAPPLDTPPAPPRVVEVVETAPLTPIPLVEETPPNTPVRPPARPPARAEAPPARPPEPKPEAPTEVPAIAADTPRPPPTTLQTTPAAAEGEVERAIRTVITRAKDDLNRVDYRLLNMEAKAQYDTAKRFIQQSEDALRPPRNLGFARSYADKAASLAAQLASR
jgi:hypothetical protein